MNYSELVVCGARIEDLQDSIPSSDDIVNFLRKDEDDAIKIVFTTYQSASKLQEAQEIMRKRARGDEGIDGFSLGLFDEAHKTIRSNKKRLCLDDASFLIQQRIFFTATPKMNCGSMMESIYGPTWYRLSFKEAVE